MKGFFTTIIMLFILLFVTLIIKNKNISRSENLALSSHPKNKFMNEKLHFITYGDEKFEKTKKRIYKEAVNSKWFYSINCYGREDLTPSFSKEFENILSMKRGGGYWIWKFDIILKNLQKIDYGDFLIYLDSGCTINKMGRKRLEQYIDMIKNNKYKIISFEINGFKEKVWTTQQIFDAFDIEENDPIKTSGIYVGGILIMEKCDNIINLFKNCLNKIRKDNLIITDHYNKNQKKYFVDNRHDQSILSVARKKNGSIVVNDKIDDKDFNKESLKKIPFLATRLRY